jgi:hypothetical protein
VKGFFAPNLEKKGRILRGVMGASLLIAGGVAVWFLWWAGLVLLASGLFTLYEAARGWCVLRACGIKTKL